MVRNIFLTRNKSWISSVSNLFMSSCKTSSISILPTLHKVVSLLKRLWTRKRNKSTTMKISWLRINPWIFYFLCTRVLGKISTALFNFSGPICKLRWTCRLHCWGSRKPQGLSAFTLMIISLRNFTPKYQKIPIKNTEQYGIFCLWTKIPDFSYQDILNYEN